MHDRGMTQDPTARVPDLDESLVTEFMTRFGLTSAPMHLKYENRGYDNNQCHLSAKHCAIENGGRRVHGWALWGFDSMLVGEHHSVWETPNRQLIDVTPPKFGADSILFIRDDAADLVEMQGVYAMWSDRTTIPDIPFAFQGNPHNEPHWGLLPDNANIVQFCQKFGIKPSDMLTDERFG